MSRLAIFIDGGYLDKICQFDFSIFIDYSKISDEIVKILSKKYKDIELLRTYYYHCSPYQSNPPTADEKARFSKKESFFAALESLPCFTVRRGRLAFQGFDKNGKQIFQQKRTDLLLGLDLAILSGKNQIQHIAILAGDSDLLPALRVAKDEGVIVWLFHGPKCSKKDGKTTFARELWVEADQRVEMDSSFMKSIKN